MNSICHESNFIIKSEKKPKSKNISMYNTSIFIGGHQNLKSKRIHLSTNTRYNNTMRRDITNFKNKKNISVDRVNNIQTEKIEKSEQIEQIDIIKMMNVRWQNNLKESRNDLNFIKKDEKKEEKKENNSENKFDINIYKKELIEKINSNYNFDDNENHEYFALLKLDKFNQKNIFVHEIIAPKSIQDFEKSLDKFIKRKCTQVNKDNNSDSTSSIGLNKKKKLNQIENKENINTNINLDEEEFNPIFILNQKDIKDLYFLIEPRKTYRTRNINYEINNFSIDYIPVQKDIILKSQNKPTIPKEENELKEQNELKEEKEIKEENEKKEEKEIKEEEKVKEIILDKINIENFELIPEKKPDNKYEITNIISISPNVELEENINEQIKENEKETINKIEAVDQKVSTEDFSQSTPLSLLQNKFSVYAVSKWIKYSVPSPQSELFIKYNYYTKKRILSPEELFMTNFTLWIERIETKRNEFKGSISISSSANSNFKQNSQQKGKCLTYNKIRNTKVKINKSNNYEIGSNGSFIKPINLKTKVFK